MIRRLRKRFIRIAMLAVTSVMLLLCLIVNIANYVSVDSELCDMLNVICENQGKIPHPPHGEGPGAGGDGRFTPETPFSTRYFVLRYTEDGELIKADLENIAAVTEDDTGSYLKTALGHGEGFGYTSGYKYLISDNGNGRRMAIFLDCHQEMRGVLMTALLSVCASAFCILLVYVIVLLCSRRAIDPVVRASEKQKQFITDAGHELKTPITVIATSLKVFELENGPQKWIGKAAAQTEKLTELVNSLVVLSRMDEGEGAFRFSEFNASEAAEEIADSFSDYALSCGHALDAHIEPDVIYRGDEYAVRRLISVLLDNAVKYASDGSRISFSLDRSKKGIVIKTSNECEGIDPGDLDKLFDRFFRADRSHSSEKSGFGIGLSIARAVAEGHGGSICAKSPDGKTVEFTAELKSAPRKTRRMR